MPGKIGEVLGDITELFVSEGTDLDLGDMPRFIAEQIVKGVDSAGDGKPETWALMATLDRCERYLRERAGVTEIVVLTPVDQQPSEQVVA